MSEQYDKVTQASMNSLYVKAQELDRGQNARLAPPATPAGMPDDVETHASTHASDCETHASARPSDVETHASDAESHASTHAGDVDAFA